MRKQRTTVGRKTKSARKRIRNANTQRSSVNMKPDETKPLARKARIPLDKDPRYVAYDHDGRKFKPSFVKKCWEASAAIKRGEGIRFETMEEFDRYFNTAAVRAQIGKTAKQD